MQDGPISGRDGLRVRKKAAGASLHLVIRPKRHQIDDSSSPTTSTTLPNGRATARSPSARLAEVTELGRRYAETKDSDVQLEICRCFHPYLMKYLTMICRGHVPTIGVGKSAMRINKDVEPFIRYFLPKGEAPNRHNLAKVVRHFHLAFKGMEPEEIYDVLMEQLIAAVNWYDPNYKEKLKEIAEVIDRELSKQKQFTASHVNRYLEFDGARHLRLLARSGFLETVSGGGSATAKPRREGLEVILGGLGTKPSAHVARLF